MDGEIREAKDASSAHRERGGVWAFGTLAREKQGLVGCACAPSIRPRARLAHLGCWAGVLGCLALSGATTTPPQFLSQGTYLPTERGFTSDDCVEDSPKPAW